MRCCSTLPSAQTRVPGCAGVLAERKGVWVCWYGADRVHVVSGLTQSRHGPVWSVVVRVFPCLTFERLNDGLNGRGKTPEFRWLRPKLPCPDLDPRPHSHWYDEECTITEFFSPPRLDMFPAATPYGLEE